MICLPIRKLISLFIKKKTRSKNNRTPPLQEPLAPHRDLWLLPCLVLVLPALYLLLFGTPLLNPAPAPINADKDVRVDPRLVQISLEYGMRLRSFWNNSTRNADLALIDHEHETHQLENETIDKSLPVCFAHNFSTSSKDNNLYKIYVKVALTDDLYPMVENGGFHKPSNCTSRDRVAILVPYRNRSHNLEIFLFNMHPFLIEQNLEYRIFVIEQYGNQTFNKGRLFNAGVRELRRFGRWRCLVFHDVDLLPTDRRVRYSCPVVPRHMCAVVLQTIKNPKYHSLFGGVTSMTIEHFKKVNGYSNLYWGWGGEDNDMFWRLKAVKLPIVRYSKKIAIYTSLPHMHRKVNKFRFELLRFATSRYVDEGLSTVEYKVMSVTTRRYYTHLLVNINPYNESTDPFKPSYSFQ